MKKSIWQAIPQNKSTKLHIQQRNSKGLQEKILNKLKLKLI